MSARYTRQPLTSEDESGVGGGGEAGGGLVEVHLVPGHTQVAAQ